MTFRPKILVVENDPALCRLLETTLKHMGAEPRFVVAGPEAAAFIETEKFDGAFVDWENPEANAEDLTRQIRGSKSNARIPIAMVSARTDQRDVAKGFAAGATFFLAKPFGASELGGLLNATRGAMLEGRRSYQRVPVSVPTLCGWGHKRGQRRLAGQCVNISSSGLLMKLLPQPQTGSAVSVELRLPGHRSTLSLKGVVVRTGPADHLAVRLVQVGKEQREQLEAFVSRHLASPLFPEG